MQILLTFLFTTSFILAKTQDILTFNKTACYDELDIELDKNGKPTDELDPNLRCLAHCAFLQMNYINQFGFIIVENLPKKWANRHLECQLATYNGDECENIEELKKCYKGRINIYGDIEMVAKTCAEETKTNITGVDKDDLFNNDKYACCAKCILQRTDKITDANVVGTWFLPYDVQNIAKDVIKKCMYKNNQADKCIRGVKRFRCVEDGLFPEVEDDF